MRQEECDIPLAERCTDAQCPLREVHKEGAYSKGRMGIVDSLI